MTESSPAVAVKARVAIVDPSELRVLWANATPDDVSWAADASAPLALDDVIPMASTMGVAEAISLVAESGESRHLRADVVSTSRGAVALVTSVFPIPGGCVLVVSENAWQADAPVSRGNAKRAGKRGR